MFLNGSFCFRHEKLEETMKEEGLSEEQVIHVLVL